MNIHKELLNYVMPRQKASEMRVEEERTYQIVIRKFGEEPKSLPPVIDLETDASSSMLSAGIPKIDPLSVRHP